jgi:hypothetical protein
MYAQMGMGDFCMDPTTNIINAIDTTASTTETFTYYATCTGVDPLAAPLADAYDAMDVMTQYINLATSSNGVCPSNEYLLSMKNDILIINNTLDDITYLSTCQPIQDEWDNIFEDSACGDVYDGLYTIWIGLYFTILFLFLLCISTSILYQYFIMTKEEQDLLLTGDISHVKNGLFSSTFASPIDDFMYNSNDMESIDTVINKDAYRMKYEDPSSL